ncbi:hypothetical protein LTR33_015609, partial [Friedmanniomyces endolithicus]
MADETTATVPVDAQEVSSTNAPSDVTLSSLRPAQPAASATEPTETTQPDAEISTITKGDEEIAGEQATTE